MGRVWGRIACLAAALAVPLTLVACTADDANFQQDILADGEVTFDEMDLAVSSYAKCLSELGIGTEAEYSELSKTYTYSLSTESADVESLLNSSEGQECKSLYIDDVELAFADQVGPTEEEDAQYYEGVAQCMRDAGFDVENTERATLSMWYEREPDAYQGCLEGAG